MLPCGSLAMLYAQNLGSLQQSLRAAADKHSVAAEQCQGVEEGAINAIMELVFRLAAGFVAGAGAGYLSHLVLDAKTPMSLPLVG